MLDAEWQTVDGLYWIRPNGNRQYPEGFIRNLSSVGDGSRVPLLLCTLSYTLLLNVNHSLVRYPVQVLLECQFEVGLHLELAALIDFRAPGIVAAVVPTPFVTFAVVHRKLGIIKHYYLDKFNQTVVFIRHKRGIRNSVAIEDRREGSLSNNRPLLPTTVSVIIPRLF